MDKIELNMEFFLRNLKFYILQYSPFFVTISKQIKMRNDLAVGFIFHSNEILIDFWNGIVHWLWNVLRH